MKTTIDHFLINCPGELIASDFFEDISDHCLIKAKLEISSLGDYRKILMKNKLVNGSPIEIYREIMADPRWPQLPFIEVASLLCHT